jgi:glycosyltransferase involved in cell wall biosynthesis
LLKNQPIPLKTINFAKKLLKMKEVRVLRIINRFNIGGPTFHVTLLTKHLGEPFDTKLVGGVPDAGESDSLHVLREYNVEPIVLEELQRNPSISSDRKAYKKIKEIIETYKPDIVHTHAAKAGALGRRAAHKCGVPIIIHTFHGHVFHSYFGKIKTAIFKQIERSLAKKSTGIIAISEQQKKELSEIHKICPADKIEVIPLGLDLTKFNSNKAENRSSMRTELGLQDNEIAIAIIGRLAPVKDHSFFLDVIERVASKTSKKIRVFIVGDGSERPVIEQRANEINQKFNELISFTSWIEDVAPLNHAMDIVCLTSKNEGTPVSLIEAQAAGVPVISTNVGGVKDIVDDGETGFIIEPNDLLDYTHKLLELIENESLRLSMSENGWSHVGKKYHYTRLIRNIEDYYLRLLQKA